MMKPSMLFLACVCSVLLFAGRAYSQNATGSHYLPGTHPVISEIPSLKSAAEDIRKFEAKMNSTPKIEYKNADADRFAVNNKYAQELEKQIALYADNEEIIAVLQQELEYTRARMNEIHNTTPQK